MKKPIQVISSTRSILSDLQEALGYEASRLAALSRLGSLTEAQSKKLVEMTKSLTAVSREEQRQRSQDVLASFSDAELAVLLQEILAKNPELLGSHPELLEGAKKALPDAAEGTQDERAEPNPSADEDES